VETSCSSPFDEVAHFLEWEWEGKRSFSAAGGSETKHRCVEAGMLWSLSLAPPCEGAHKGKDVRLPAKSGPARHRIGSGLRPSFGAAAAFFPPALHTIRHGYSPLPPDLGPRPC
jgi:hypothetical protein